MQESPYLDGNSLLLERMHSLPFFETVNDKHIRDILRLSKIRRFDHGEVITRENSFDSWVYVLLSGSVRVVKKDKEIAKLDDVGSIFGELAVIDRKARSATVESVGPTVCLAINVAFMNETTEPLELAKFVSILYKLFAEILAQRLRETSEELSLVRAELERLRHRS